MEQPQQPAPAATCNFCGKPLATDQILYTADARIACAACNAKVDIVVADMRVGNNIRNASIYSVVAAAIGFISILNVLCLITASSMIAAIYSLVSVNRRGDERFTRHIQKDKGTIYACAIIALVLDGIVIVLFILAYIALASMHRHEVQEYNY